MDLPEIKFNQGVHLQLALGPSAMVQRANWTNFHLSQMGVRVHSGNRLQKAKQLIEQFTSPKFTLQPEDEALQRRIIDAHKSIYEQYVITRCFARDNNEIEKGIMVKIEVMLGGADKEEEDRNSIARDTQFELYVASTLMMGGIMVQFDEPDLRFHYGEELMGVAVKRLKSPKQLEKRVKAGVAQLEKSTKRGFIAVNLDMFLKKVRLVGEDSDRFAQFDKSNIPFLKLEPLLEQNPMVIGILAFGSTSSWVFGEGKPQMDSSNFHRFVSYSDDPEEKEFGQMFLNNLISNIRMRLNTI
jgi:hypothetical protein